MLCGTVCLRYDFQRIQSWKPAAAIVYWHEEVVGVIAIQRRTAITGIGLGKDGDKDRIPTIAPLNASALASPKGFTLGAPGKLGVLYGFEPEPKETSDIDVFNLALNLFAEVAIKGLESRVQHLEIASGLTIRLIFVIEAAKDHFGNTDLRNDHVRTAILQILDITMEKKQFR